MAKMKHAAINFATALSKSINKNHIDICNRIIFAQGAFAAPAAREDDVPIGQSPDSSDPRDEPVPRDGMARGNDPLAGLMPDPVIGERGYAIGCIGAGFIMADIHLEAYARAGFNVAAIASRTRAKAEETAGRRGIAKVHDTPEALIADPGIEILDIAYPPHLQPDLIRLACRQPHIKAILAQKPLSMDYASARAVVEECRAAGTVLSINQNMRFDQSMRVLKQLLDRGDLGATVTATVEMRAIPHWQGFLADYDRLTLLNMGIHHLDALRFLFGEPRSIYTAVRPDPRTAFDHTDGICVSILDFDGPIATTMEDVWTGPKTEGPHAFEPDVFIKWRVEGRDGIAEGTIGWPDYPEGSPSTLRFASQITTQGRWVTPEWTTQWFPDAFAGVMGQLQEALAAGAPPLLSGDDNLKTMALVDAAYRSAAERRPVSPRDIIEEENTK